MDLAERLPVERKERRGVVVLAFAQPEVAAGDAADLDGEAAVVREPVWLVGEAALLDNRRLRAGGSNTEESDGEGECPENPNLPWNLLRIGDADTVGDVATKALTGR